MIHQSKIIAGNKLLNYHYAFHSRFMIGCDYCNDWFHGSCVVLVQKKHHLLRLTNVLPAVRSVLRILSTLKV